MTYPFLSASKARSKSPYSPLMPMKGYDYGCHGLFQHFQSISELEHHPPSDRIPFPHSTSNFGKTTSYEPSKSTNTSESKNPQTYQRSKHSNTSKTGNLPIPPSTRPMKPSPPGASSTRQRSMTANSPIPPFTKPIKPALQATSTKQPSDRIKRYRARLLAVNGIVTASNGPVTKITSPQHQDNRCPICGRGHNRPYHLESHFITCAEKNGNPEGYLWNELVVNKGRGSNKRERDVASDKEEEEAENGGGKRARGTRER